MEYTFNFSDRYNGDAQKGVTLPFGHRVTDTELGRLHLVGLAQEYDMVGTYTMRVYWHKGYRYPTDPGQTNPSAKDGTLSRVDLLLVTCFLVAVLSGCATVGSGGPAEPEVTKEKLQQYGIPILGPWTIRQPAVRHP